MRNLLLITFIFFHFAAKSQDSASVYITKTFPTTGAIRIVNLVQDSVLIKIFNRWGNTVYSKDTVLESGNHLFLFGEQLTLGTYYYVIKVGEYVSKYYIHKVQNYTGLKIALSDTTCFADRTIEIPITISNTLLTENFISYQFDFNYDSTKLEYIGANTVGTLAEGGSLQLNPKTGKLSIAWARGTELVGEGAVLKLQFKSIDAGISTPTITNAFFNTTAITSISNGKITSSYKYGDIDGNELVQAFDAALAIQYSVGLDPMPTIDPIPWANWRIMVANVDGQDGVTANDASDILKYTIGLITSFSAGKKSETTLNTDVSVNIENENIVFYAIGDLFGLNLVVNENKNILGKPQFLNANLLTATNISATSYAIGLATANAIIAGEIFMKIPFKAAQNTNVAFEMLVNGAHKRINIGTATGLATIEDNGISIYPNPTADILYIIGTQNANIQVFDINGKLVINKQNISNQIIVSELQAGVYTVKLIDKSGIQTRKFIKQ